jgi:hypothetical protein
LPRNRQTATSHKLLSVVTVDLSRDIFEQLFYTLQMLQGLSGPCAPVDHCGRHPKVHHEDDPEGDEN